MLNIGSVYTNLRGHEESSSSSSRNSGLFFDSVTERVCAVRAEGNESVFSAYSLDPARNEFTFRSRERGRIRSICFSPDLHLASIQQEDTVVDFLLLSDGKVAAEFRQISKFKGAIILGIHWVAERHISFVTDAGCEFYLVNSHRRTLKMVKNVSLSVNWFSYYPPSKLFVFSSGIANNNLLCQAYQNGTICNIGRFELDFGKSPAKPRLLERDIAIASIYGRVCILALKFEPTNGFAMGVNIFEWADEQQPAPKCTHFLRLDLVGLVGMQVVDNLLLVHHKNAQRSLLFDIRISTERPIHCAPLFVDRKLADHFQGQNGDLPGAFLYNSAWKMSPSGFVIDLQLEIFTRVQFELDKAVELIHNLEEKIQFLINRGNSEKAVLELLHGAILNKELKFNRLTQLLCQLLHDPRADGELGGGMVQSPKPNNGGKWCAAAAVPPFRPLTVSHNSILRAIFEPLHRHPQIDKKQLANLMVDFILSLKQRKIKIENHYMPELLLKIVANAKLWTCLQQLLQYRVIDDSKFLAFELIALSDQCATLYQIALDMLSRRGNCEQIAQVLLDRGHILDALRFLSDMDHGEGGQRMDKICLKLIAAAWGKHPPDRPLMYTIFSHLERIGRLKGLAESGNEDFERFSGEFKCLYDDKELREAEMRFRLARLSSMRRGRRDSHFNNDSFTSTAGDENDQVLREEKVDSASNNMATDGGSSSSGGF